MSCLYSEVVIVVRKGDERDVAKVIELFELKIKYDIVSVDTSKDPGTAESLRILEKEKKLRVSRCVILF